MERRVSNGHLSVVEPAVGRVPLRVALFTCGPAGAIGRAVGLPGDGVLIDAVGLDRLAVGVADQDGLGALAEVLGPLFGAHADVISRAPILVDHAGISEIVVNAGADGLVVIGRVIEGAVVVERALHARLALTAVLRSTRAVPGAVSLGALLDLLTPVARAAHAVRGRRAGLANRRRALPAGDAPRLSHQARRLDEGVAVEALGALRLARAVGQLLAGLRIDADVEAVATPGARLVGLVLSDEPDAGAQLPVEALSVGLTVAGAVPRDSALGVLAHAHQALAVRVRQAGLTCRGPFGVGNADSVDDLAGDEHGRSAAHTRLHSGAVGVLTADDALVLDQAGHAVDEIGRAAPLVTEHRGVAHVLAGAW